MKSITVLGLTVAACALLAPLAAQAADTQISDMEQKAWYMADAPRAGWYLYGAGMGSFQIDADSKVSGTTSTIEYNPGWGVSAGSGYAFGNGFRAEGELVYRRAGVDQVEATEGSGRIRNFALMANGYYDIATGTRFTPYIGAGIGASLVDANDMQPVNARTLDGQKGAFAYQGIVGVTTAIDHNWSLITDYRYFRTTDVTFATDTTASAETENASHNFVVGLRYSFGTAPAEPAPAIKPIPTIPSPPLKQVGKVVVPAVPQSYMVFFDFDKATLTPEAKRIVAAAAQDFKSGKYVRIVVTGHTDTMGSAQYNQKLSEKRASTVRKEFSFLGIPQEQVMMTGAGKSTLLVPTADGVREAQNRRAEIVFNQ